MTGPSDGSDPGLATLTVRVAVAPEDAELAQELGWDTGIPAATVYLLRMGETSFETATTNLEGRAQFERVVRGTYRLYASRTLSAGEAQGIGEPIRAFGDGRTVEITEGGPLGADLNLLSDRPPGLVISEIGRWTPPELETGNAAYLEASYFEVYNGSGATMFLDGMIFGVTFWTGETNPTPCTQTLPGRTDPAGPYVGKVLQFPGGGSEHPIHPGEAKVIPISAIDHTSVHPGLYDLSNAAFEIRGVGSADNPSVPDMLDIGLEPFVTPLAGISLNPLTGSSRAFVLAERFDPRSAPILLRDGNGRGFVRVPAEIVFDVVSVASIWPDSDLNFPQCVPTVHPSFDRYEGGYRLLGSADRISYQRRVLRQEGVPVLQDTNTSAFDLIQYEPTPGTLPPR